MKEKDAQAIKIEKYVPIPPNKGAKFASMPFEKLKVGESFFILFPTENPTHQERFNFTSGVSHQGQAVARRLDRRFTVRQVEGGVRVWRLW